MLIKIQYIPFGSLNWQSSAMRYPMFPPLKTISLLEMDLEKEESILILNKSGANPVSKDSFSTHLCSFLSGSLGCWAGGGGGCSPHNCLWIHKKMGIGTGFWEVHHPPTSQSLLGAIFKAFSCKQQSWQDICRKGYLGKWVLSCLWGFSRARATIKAI